MEMRLTVQGLEKERDFYFSKLRDIEMMCQEEEDGVATPVQKLLDILYATEVRGGGGGASLLYKFRVRGVPNGSNLTVTILT